MFSVTNHFLDRLKADSIERDVGYSWVRTNDADIKRAVIPRRDLVWYATHRAQDDGHLCKRSTRRLPDDTGNLDVWVTAAEFDCQ